MPRTTTTPKPSVPAMATAMPEPETSTIDAVAAHRPSRRTDIIDAAIRLFARKGFVDAVISEVAEEAGVAVTAIYYHFSGKESFSFCKP